MKMAWKVEGGRAGPKSKVRAGKRTLNWLNDPLLLFRSTTAEIHREHIARCIILIM